MTDTTTIDRTTIEPPPTGTSNRVAAVPPSRGVRLAWLIVGGLLAIAALVWGTFNVLSLLAHEEYDTTSTFAASDVDTVDVSNENGSVTVNASATDTIVVTAHVSDGWQSTKVSTAISGGQLFIRGGCPILGSPWCSVDYTVEIPADRPMRIRSSNGSIRVRGATGTIDVDSDNGSIDLDDVGGNITVSNDNGRITARRLTSSIVTASNDNGRIELSFHDPPQSVSATTSNGRLDVVVPDDDVLYRVELRTSNGSTDNAVRTDPGSDRVIVLRSDNGSITLRPPG